VVDGIRTINQGFPAGYFDKYVDDEGSILLQVLKFKVIDVLTYIHRNVNAFLNKM
jgi:hypothetical protein